MRTLPRNALVAGAAVVLALAMSAAPASAATVTNGASAYAAAGATGTAKLAANLQLKGPLGKILDALISPIVSNDLNPLVAALQGSANGLVSQSLAAPADSAATVANQQQVTPAPAAFPNDTLPSPCNAGGNQPCFSVGSTASIDWSPLAKARVGNVSGYAEQVAASADATNPIFGRASAASPQVSALPGISSLVPALPSAVNPLVSSGQVQAKANCPNDGAVGAPKPVTAPSVSESVTGVTILGSQVTFGVTDGQIVNLVVNGTSYPIGVSSLPTVTLAGGVTVSGFGADVLVSIPITVDQILNGLGLPSSVVSDLDGLSPTSTLVLRLVVGPNSQVTKTSVTAWGLGIGVDLSGTLGFNLMDLVTANVNVPTGIAGNNLGNVLDLRLAYVTCQSGVNLAGGGGTAVPAVPAALV